METLSSHLQSEILEGIQTVSLFFSNISSEEGLPSFRLEKDLLSSRKLDRKKKQGAFFARELTKRLENLVPDAALAAVFLLEALLEETLVFCRSGLDTLSAAKLLEMSSEEVKNLLYKTKKITCLEKKRIVKNFPEDLGSSSLFLEALSLSFSSSLIVTQDVLSSDKVTQKKGRVLPFVWRKPPFLVKQQKIGKTIPSPFFTFFSQKTLTLEEMLQLRKKLPERRPLIILTSKVEENVLASALFQETEGKYPIYILTPKVAMSVEETQEYLIFLPQVGKKQHGIATLEEAILSPKKCVFFQKKSFYEETITIFSMKKGASDFAENWLAKEVDLQERQRKEKNSFPLLDALFVARLSSKRPLPKLWERAVDNLWQKKRIKICLSSHLKRPQKHPGLLEKFVCEQGEKRGLFLPTTFVEDAIDQTVKIAIKILQLGAFLPS